MKHTPFHIGIVESRMDPLKLGRVQVRVFGVHSESVSDIPTSSLPWAIPLMPATSASVSGIGHSPTQYVEGTFVVLFFQDGESKQQPVIIGSYHGIPVSNNPLDIESVIGEEPLSAITNSTVLPTAENTLLDSSGTPVTDSNGSPIVTTSVECCSGLDAYKLVAEFGENVSTLCKTLCDYGIKDQYAVAAILANVAKESRFKLVRESLKYSSVSRLRTIFSSKFSKLSDDEAAVYVNNETLLANYVYANRLGNRDIVSGDGFKYRGGGFIQLTFKDNYSVIGKSIGIDLANEPDLINRPDIAAKAVAQYFINRYGGANKLKFDSLESACDSVTRKVNPGGFNNDIGKVRKYASLIVISGVVQADNELKNPVDPSSSIDTTASKQKIDTGTNTSAVGFKDPIGKFPLKSLLKEQDINRLARRNTKDTSVQKKLNNRRTNIKTGSDEWSEPLPPYNAAYPYNHVYSTESGHNMEFDDTSGSERISLFHTTGTYTEIDKFGTRVNKIIGDSYSITERNGYVYIDGTARLTVGSDVKISIAGNLDISVDGNLNYDVGGSVNWKIGESVNSSLGGSYSINSIGSVDIDGSTINLNSGTSGNIGHSARSGVSNDYEIQKPENFLGAEELDFDDADEDSVITAQQLAVLDGKITAKDLKDGEDSAKKPVSSDDTKPPKELEPVTVDCSIFDKNDNIENIQISKYFNIAMLSSKAVVSHYNVQSQNGMSKSEIACNLKNLAENCLDPIRSKYPNMFVTSGFRQGTGTSQHNLGRAADMQFTGVSKSEYFEIAKWIRDNVVFDQLLLEYKTTGTRQPWIHISFNTNGNRKSVMTFMNNLSVGTGLKQLET